MYQNQNCNLEKYAPLNIVGLQTAMGYLAWFHYTLGQRWLQHHPHQTNFLVHGQEIVDDQDKLQPQQLPV